VPTEDDLLILGPGTVPEQLERHVVEGDAHHGRGRVVAYEAAAPLTTRQLAARLRTFAGVEPPRRTVGSGGSSERVGTRPVRPPLERPPGEGDLAATPERGRSR
jgi:hypothetical protein